MICDGKTVFTLWGYKPQTKLALVWEQRSDGNHRGSDRSSLEDVYSSRVVFEGPIDELTDLETVLNDNRTQFDATFNSGEEIFGADVNHSGLLSITVTNYGTIQKSKFKVYSMTLELRLIQPTFKAVNADFSKLRKASHSDTRETIFQLNKMFNYDGDGFVADHLSNDGSEPGTFKANFIQTKEEMPAIRKYIRTTARAKQIPFADFDDLTFPFGTRAGAGPFNCRLIAWDDGGRLGLCDWGLSLTFARDLSYWNE